MDQLHTLESITTQIESPRSHYGSFQIGPLRGGQGITIGNALRRVLLGDIRGIAIISAKIEGVQHEFASLPKARESVLEVLLNLKEIVLKGPTDLSDPLVGSISVVGPARVEARDLQLPPEIEVVDPSQVIAHIASDGVFSMECMISSGIGYKLPPTHRSDSDQLGYLAIDAIFMPVRRVNYKIDASPDGWEIITLEIWTNGSLTPQTALEESIRTLQDLLKPIESISSKPLLDIPVSTPVPVMPIEDLQLSRRAFNCLKRAEVHTVADLLEYSLEDLLELKNFGSKSAQDVCEVLERRLGYSLKKRNSLS